VSQRLSESAVKGSIRWYTEDERKSMELSGLSRFKVPMGIRPDGRKIFPIAGASPDDPSNDDGGAGGSGDGGGAGGSEGQGGSGDDGGAGGTGEKDAGGKESETVSKSEYDKVLERMKAADRNSAEALKKLKELEEKDLSEQEKVAKRVPELEAQVTELSEENKGLKAKVAFLESNSHSWHNPETALKLADLSEVYGEDGSVDKKALKKAMDDLAKENPFLVKAANDDGKGGGGKGGTGAGGNGQGSSGSNVGGGGKGGTNGTDEAALRAKYPALNL